MAPTDGQPKENTEPANHGNTGPARLKPGQRGLSGLEDMVPVVAFKERRAIRTLTSLDEIQTHQRTGKGREDRMSHNAPGHRTRNTGDPQYPQSSGGKSTQIFYLKSKSSNTTLLLK